MSKSVKLKDNIYLDSSSIVHKRKNMQEIMNDMENSSLKSKTQLSFSSMNELQNYAASLKPNWTTYIFHVSIGGNGRTVIVSKTTDLYSAMLVFGYGQITLYSLTNGVWSSRNL